MHPTHHRSARAEASSSAPRTALFLVRGRLLSGAAGRPATAKDFCVEAVQSVSTCRL